MPNRKGPRTRPKVEESSYRCLECGRVLKSGQSQLTGYCAMCDRAPTRPLEVKERLFAREERVVQR